MTMQNKFLQTFLISASFGLALCLGPSETSAAVFGPNGTGISGPQGATNDVR